MASDPGMEACSPLSDGNRSPAMLTVEEHAGAEKQSREEDRSVTACDPSEASPKSGTVDLDSTSTKAGETVEVDTSKVHVKESNLEARPVFAAPEVVRHSIGLEHVSNLEILNAPSQPPPWMTKKRWFVLGCGIVLVLIVAIVVIGLVAGLVLTRRSGDGDNSNSNSNSSTTGGLCGGGVQIKRPLLAAATVGSALNIFGRGIDNKMWAWSFHGDGSQPNSWAALMPDDIEGVFSGPPTAINWAPRGIPRMNVFAPGGEGNNVITASYINGTPPNSWENLGASTAGPVNLCRIPEGFVNAGADPAERIDQWIIDRESRSILHNYWNNVMNAFNEPAVYADWESSPAQQPSASSTVETICRREDPVHTVLMFANNTKSVRFRHYTAMTRQWNAWVDIGGRFKGDPVLLPLNETHFTFFGVNEAAGSLWTFNWTNATGVGFRPVLAPLGGEFSSMPSAVLTSASPLQIDVVGLGQDGVFKHKAYKAGRWAENWEDLGITGSSAPLLFKYEMKPTTGGEAPRNLTVLAAIGDDKQLRFASWDTSTNTPWKELVQDWPSVGGSLTTKSMCD